MLRGSRHKLIWSLAAGWLLSGGVALAIYPAAWGPITLVLAGTFLTVLICERFARRHLRRSLGRLRRLADALSRGQYAGTFHVPPGGDFYKLVNAINEAARRMNEARRKEARLQEELRRSERLAFLGELAASVAHEVNNPLDGIQNCARILRRSMDDPARARQMLDLIDGGLTRIETIVRRLLTLARHQVIRPEPRRLREVVDASLLLVREKLAVRHVALEREDHCDDDLVAVDPPLMEQVFVNLATNAIDSMEPGGRLRICTRCAGDEEVGASERDAAAPESGGRTTWLAVEVADTGCGIAPEALPHIFEPFFTTRAGGKGTGLGLPIAQRIVDAHHGAIRVRPREGGGTVFTVLLPACGAAQLRSAARAPTRGSGDLSAAPLAHGSLSE